jgi:hypothetical protein
MSDPWVDAHNPATEFEGKTVSAASKPEASVEAVLDAVTLRSRGEFDPNLAKAMHSVLGEAIRMVEAGTVRADKATPGITSLPTYAKYLLGSHRNHYSHGEAGDLYRIQHIPNQNVLFSEDVVPSGPRADDAQPLHIANLGARLPPDREIQPPAERAESGSRPAEEISASRIFVAGGLPVGITTAGVLLAIGSAVTDPIKPNPYVAITVLILGIGLILTALAALRERRQGT